MALVSSLRFRRYRTLNLLLGILRAEYGCQLLLSRLTLCCASWLLADSALGASVLGASVLGASVLGASVLGASVLGASALCSDAAGLASLLGFAKERTIFS